VEDRREGMITDFFKGIILGFVFSAILFAFVGVLVYRNRKEKEIIKYVEIQREIEALQEDYSNRDPVEFFDSIEGVRGAADGAIGDFDRKRDEALLRFRSGLSD
jgi:hypothetical protein